MLPLLPVLSPEPQKDMGLEDEQRMLTGSGDPKEEEEEEELVDPLTTVREQCEQLEKYVKAGERLELCDERVSSRSQMEEDRTEQLLTSCMQGTTVWPTNCLTA